MIIALILMVVIGIGSTASLRLAMTGSEIASGLRASNEAQQAADLALRWCELQVRRVAAGEAPPAAANFQMVGKGELAETAWQDYRLFTQNSRPVPGVLLNDAGMLAGNVAPRCMVQESSVLAATPEDDKDQTGANSSFSLYRIFTITVRGMSRDFVEDVDGDGTARGGEVWQQSTLAVSPRN